MTSTPEGGGEDVIKQLAEEVEELEVVEETEAAAAVKVEPESKTIAFTRVFSGKLQVGQKLFVLGPKYDPSTIDFTQVRISFVGGTEEE